MPLSACGLAHTAPPPASVSKRRPGWCPSCESGKPGKPRNDSTCGDESFTPRYGSKLSHWGTADFSLCFHLPGFHFGYLCLTHSHQAFAADLGRGAGAFRSALAAAQPPHSATAPSGRRRRCPQRKHSGAKTWLWVENRYPKWNPGKWKHGAKPAVPWWFHTHFKQHGAKATTTLKPQLMCQHPKGKEQRGKQTNKRP